MIAPVLKTGRPKGLVSSNLTPSASLRFGAQRKSEGCHAGVKRRRASVFNLFYGRSNDYGLAGQQMQAFVYVYILVSEANQTIHYTGITRDLEQRLLEHNPGKCRHTAQHRPSRIETAVTFRSEGKGVFERYLKSGSGREFARRHF